MNKLFIKLIKMYKQSGASRGSCKYIPTCSSYSLECFEKYCFFKALGLTIWRILRCNPFSKGGYDPSPFSICEKEYEYLVYDIFRKD
ncbi:MAG: membrane protein insertion efficiency factor YidD [Bacilli bacterium]|nr:membrane protein insertion efficiency factor YidD [Bacilli bacterium]